MLWVAAFTSCVNSLREKQYKAYSQGTLAEGGGGKLDFCDFHAVRSLAVILDDILPPPSYTVLSKSDVLPELENLLQRLIVTCVVL